MMTVNEVPVKHLSILTYNLDTLHDLDLILCLIHRLKMPMDAISLRNFHMTAAIGPDAWNRWLKLQPIVLTLKLEIDTTSAGKSDEIGHTFSYGQMCKDVAVLSGEHFFSVDDLILNLVTIAISAQWPGESLQVFLLAPKALLRVEGGLGRQVTLQKQLVGVHPTWTSERQVWLVKQLKMACIIGVNPHERLEKQQVNVDLEIVGQHGIENNSKAEQDGEKRSIWVTLVSRLCCVSLHLTCALRQNLHSVAGYLLACLGCRTI